MLCLSGKSMQQSGWQSVKTNCCNFPSSLLACHLYGEKVQECDSASPETSLSEPIQFASSLILYCTQHFPSGALLACVRALYSLGLCLLMSAWGGRQFHVLNPDVSLSLPVVSSLMLAEASWYKERLTGGGMSLTLLSVCLKEGEKASSSLPPKLVLLFLCPWWQSCSKCLHLGGPFAKPSGSCEDFIMKTGKSPGFDDIRKEYSTHILCGFPQSSLLAFIR